VNQGRREASSGARSVSFPPVSAEEWSAFLSLVAAIVIVCASFFKWWDVTYDYVRTRRWVMFLLLPGVLLLLLSALVLFLVAALGR
jgi:hypothetical protein